MDACVEKWMGERTRERKVIGKGNVKEKGAWSMKHRRKRGEN